MNEFEKQIRTAVTEQDTPSLNRGLWLGIKDDLVQQKKRRIRKRIIQFGLAASFLILLGFFLLKPKQVENKEQVVLEHYGLEHYAFPQKVDQKLMALNGSKIPSHQVEQFDALKSQLYFLDQQYMNYLDYIEVNGYQEFIGMQIQNYYEVKIELLEKIQKEIEKLKSKDHESIKKVDWQI